MSFICHFCSQHQPPRTTAHKVVTQYRMYQHPVRPKAMVRTVVKNGKKKKEYVTDPGGVGLQIVQEVFACPQCHADWDRQQKRQQGLLPEGQSGVVIHPLPKPVVKEVTPEPRRPFNRDNRDNRGGGWRKPQEGTTAGGTQERSFRPGPGGPPRGPRTGPARGPGPRPPRSQAPGVVAPPPAPPKQ